MGTNTTLFQGHLISVLLMISEDLDVVCYYHPINCLSHCIDLLRLNSVLDGRF